MRPQSLALPIFPLAPEPTPHLPSQSSAPQPSAWQLYTSKPIPHPRSHPPNCFKTLHAPALQPPALPPYPLSPYLPNACPPSRHLLTGQPDARVRRASWDASVHCAGNSARRQSVQGGGRLLFWGECLRLPRHGLWGFAS